MHFNITSPYVSLKEAKQVAGEWVALFNQQSSDAESDFIPVVVEMQHIEIGDRADAIQVVAYRMDEGEFTGDEVQAAMDLLDSLDINPQEEMSDHCPAVPLWV